MMKKWLVIMEVSQKQAYIFRSKKLKNNVKASDIIRYVTSVEFFEKEFKAQFNKDANLVYTGGGHTVLGFDTQEKAKAFGMTLSKYLFDKYDGLEVFVKMHERNDDLSPSENVKELIKALEVKKATRYSAFRQGSFGIEKLNLEDKDKELDGDVGASEISENEKEHVKPYELVDKFEKLGGSKNENNFISVIHIDGNLMGKRVFENDKEIDEKTKNLTDQPDKRFEEYCKEKQKFSDDIDEMFGDAYLDMLEVVKSQLEKGKLTELSLENKAFPVRRIITAGDDICFVTEGRIGIECAVTYMKKLWEKRNHKYSACAGVAIVHQKYPFYKAYELAESLCGNAKRYISELSEDGVSNACSIDWHIEYGEMRNSLGEIREQYVDSEGKSIIGRPYFLCGDDKCTENAGERTYACFKENMKEIAKGEDKVARGKVKKLRTVIKEGPIQTENYIKRNLLADIITINDKLFDSIEVLDTYIAFEEE